MTERFTASNGWQVHRLEDGQCSLTKRVGHRDEVTWCGPDVYQAIAEHVQAERDAELGRWRSKKHPNYFAVREGNHLRVCDERMLRVWGFRNPFDVYDYDEEGRTATEVAREWFDAQEPPKPGFLQTVTWAPPSTLIEEIELFQPPARTALLSPGLTQNEPPAKLLLLKKQTLGVAGAGGGTGAGGGASPIPKEKDGPPGPTVTPKLNGISGSDGAGWAAAGLR